MGVSKIMKIFSHKLIPTQYAFQFKKDRIETIKALCIYSKGPSINDVRFSGRGRQVFKNRRVPMQRSSQYKRKSEMGEWMVKYDPKKSNIIYGRPLTTTENSQYNSRRSGYKLYFIFSLFSVQYRLVVVVQDPSFFVAQPLKGNENVIPFEAYVTGTVH